jgi:hypothetical protein
MSKLKTPFELFQVECNDGWKGLYQPLLDLCKLYDIEVLQVKEKFGGLRFYCAGKRAGELEDLIRAAEAESYKTCEDCGASGQMSVPTAHGTNKWVSKVSIGKDDGWVRSLCAPCREKWYEARKK